MKVKKGAKRLLRKLGLGKKKKKDTKIATDDLHVGEEIDFKAAGKSHELWFKEEGPGVKLWVASNDPKPVMVKLQDWNSRIQSDDNSKESKEKRNLTRDVKKLVEDIELEGADVEKLIMQQDKSPQRVKKGEGLTEKQVKTKNDSIKKKELLISKHLTRLFELFGEQDQMGGETPIVGKHPLKGKFRESHHVAENSFMEQVKEFYGVVGKGLQKDNNPLNDLGGKLVARSQFIEQNFTEGKNLSAILLHRETHRTAKDKAVHATGLQKEVQGNIESSAHKNKKIAVLGVKSDGVKRAQMFEGDWKSLIKKIYDLVRENKDFKLKESDDEIIIESKGRDKEALNKISRGIDKEIKGLTENDDLELDFKREEILKAINDTAMNSYESALSSGLETVRTALSKSTFDGDKKEHPRVIGKLKRFAEKIWESSIVKKIE